ncbi:MAG: phosphotransferase [Phycisphaeraceae bacterium]|nr:phosphotransferase [Phycisphaeraceae bacterium]
MSPFQLTVQPKLAQPSDDGQPMAATVAFSVLEARAVTQLVRQAYGLDGAVAGCLYNHSVNDTYELRLDARRWYFRLYGCGRRRAEEVEAELDVIDLARAAGIKAAACVPAAEGIRQIRMLAPEGQRIGVLFAQAAAPRFWQLTEPICGRWGQAVAKMHRAFDKAPGALDRPILDLGYVIEEPLRVAMAALADVKPAVEVLSRVGAAMSRWFSVEGRQGEYGLCHGDLHISNMALDAGDWPVFFDFETCGYGWRGYDLAAVCLVLSARRISQAGWRAFVKGYLEGGGRAETVLPANINPWVVARLIWNLGGEAKHFGRLGVQNINRTQLAGMVKQVEEWINEHGLFVA